MKCVPLGVVISGDLIFFVRSLSLHVRFCVRFDVRVGVRFCVRLVCDCVRFVCDLCAISRTCLCAIVRSPPSVTSKAVQGAVQDFILKYTSSRGTKFQWGVVLHRIEATLHKMQLGHHAHPPVDFCPIPWCRNSCKLPLGLFFEQKDKSERVILGVPFPS